MAHYKVTNTTKHPGVKKGSHKNGFFVTVLTGKLMGPGRHILVEKITPGMLAMQRKGYVSITEVDDINLEVKKEVAHVEKQNEARRIEQEKAVKNVASAKAKESKEQAAQEIAEAEALKKDSVVESSLDKQAMKDTVRNGVAKNTATVSGNGLESNEDPLGDTEEAVSTDGLEPNFVVKAGKNRRRK